MISMTRNSWPHVWQLKTYQMYHIQTEHWKMSSSFAMSDRGVDNNRLGEAVTPSHAQPSQKHFKSDTSLHQHICNLLSYKDEHYDTFTSSYNDCVTAGFFATHLHSILAWNPYKSPHWSDSTSQSSSSKRHARHWSLWLTFCSHKYEKLNNKVYQLKENQNNNCFPLQTDVRGQTSSGNNPSQFQHKGFIVATIIGRERWRGFCSQQKTWQTRTGGLSSTVTLFSWMCLTNKKLFRVSDYI